MIDAALFRGSSNDDWFLDINIVKGIIQLVNAPVDRNARNQRKAVLAYQIRGTIPGDWERGIAWSSMLSADKIPLGEAMMEVQRALSEDEGGSAEQSFSIPVLSMEGDGLRIQLLTVSPNDLEELKR